MTMQRPFAFGPEEGYTSAGNDPKYANMVPVLDLNGLLDSSLFNIATGEMSGGILNTQGVYYVDPTNGDDGTGDGSISLPFKTINAALAADTTNAGVNTSVYIGMILPPYVGAPLSVPGGTVTDDRHENIYLTAVLAGDIKVSTMTFNNAPASGAASLTLRHATVGAASCTNAAVDFTVDCRDSGRVDTASSSNGANAGFFYVYGTDTPGLTNMNFVPFSSAVTTLYTPTTPADWSSTPADVGAGLDTLAGDLTGKLNTSVGAVVANQLAIFSDATGENIDSSGILSTDLYTTIAEGGGGISLVTDSAAPLITFKTIEDNGDAALVISEAAGLITFSLLPGNIDHGGLVGIGDDDHTMYVHNSVNRTISAQHTFNPGSAGAPFILGINSADQLVTGLNAEKLSGSIATDNVWNAGLIDGITVDNTGIVDTQYLGWDQAQNKFLPVTPLDPTVAQFNALSILGRTVDDANIGDTRVLAYDQAQNKLLYTDVLNPAVAQFNASRIQTIDVDITGLANGDALVFNNVSGNFEASGVADPTVEQFNASQIKSKTVDDTLIADTFVLSYSSGSDTIIYRDIPLETVAAFNAAKIQDKDVNVADIADKRALLYNLGGDEFVFEDIAQDLPGVVAIERRYLIEDLDLKSLSDTSLLTIPVGQRMVIDQVQVLIKTASGVSVVPTVSVGITGNLAKYVAAVSMAGAATDVGHREDLTLATLDVVAAGDEVTFSVTVQGAASGAYTATVMFRGTILTT